MEIPGRLLPATGAYPVPGKDVSGAKWQSLLRRGEVIVFTYVAKTLAPLSAIGNKPDSPISEHGIAFPKLLLARAFAAGLVGSEPDLLCVTYRKSGRWVETRTNQKVEQRNPRLERIVSLLRSTIPVRSLAVESGSPSREELYQAVTKQPRVLVPEKVSLQPSERNWSRPKTYAGWSAVLEPQGFRNIGRYLVPEIGVLVEFWTHEQEELRVTIWDRSTTGMGLAVISQYQDGTVFEVTNSKPSGLDHYPKDTIVSLGPKASISTVLETARRDRPEGARVVPTSRFVLSEFVNGWRERVLWRRSRGVSVEEIKRVDESCQK